MTVDPTSWQTETRDFLGRECDVLTPTGCLQRHANEGVMRVARLMGLPLLLSLDSHFTVPEKKLIQDIGLDNSTGGSMRFSSCYSMMDTPTAWDMWVHLHGDGDVSQTAFAAGVENNHALAALTEPVTFPSEFHLPPVEVPVEIQSRSTTEEESWERLIMVRVREYGRFPGVGDERRPAYAARLAEELQVIARNGTINFLPYFIALHDVCRYARDNDVLVGPGRGSAAGSLLSYLLKITHLDPIEYRLSFARFLSLGRIARGKFPDIDLDFGDPDFIAAHLRELHGDRFVRVSTTGTLKPKSAIKDVARVLLNTKENKPLGEEVEAITKSMPNVPQGMENLLGWMYGYEDETGSFPGQVAENPLLAEFLGKYPAVKEAVDALVGLPKSIGRHASGFILADVAVGEIVPTMIMGKDKEREVCTQFTKDDVEKLGLIKMDLLGLNTLKDIRGALDLIAQRGGPVIDIYTLPVDDAATFDAFCAGENETVFQFNSDIATNLCRQVQPRSVDDLSQITANGRPGTMYATLEDGKTTLIDAWVSRRQGKSPVTYVHPDLEDILSNTVGIFVFQEQVAAAFQRCCGFTEERADEIREIVGKKKIDKMEKILPEIRERLVAAGWSASQVASFVSLCIAASSYSFNASHSAAYAYLGYVCQYLKTHYPLEWWTSVLQNSKAEDLELNARHCRQFLLPPDVNHSDLDFYILDGVREKIVYPLSRVKGVKSAGPTLVKYRPYTSLEDFVERVPRSKEMKEAAGITGVGGTANRGVVAALIWSGAFDELCGVKEPMGRVDVYRRYLDARGVRNKPRLDEEAALPTNEFEVLMRQNTSLPLNAADFSGLISKQTGISILDPERLDKARGGQYVRVAGYVQSVRVIKIKKAGPSCGKPMAFIDLVNRSRVVSVTVFPDTYEPNVDMLKEGRVLLVGGKVDDFRGRRAILADHLQSFGEAELDPEEMNEKEREKLAKKNKTTTTQNNENNDDQGTSTTAELPD